MSTPFHNKVSLRGFHFEDFSLTVKLAAGIVAADVGKALAVDGSNPNQLRLAGDGDAVIARLATVENRAVEGQLIGAAEFRFANVLPIKAGEVVAAGDTAVGAGNGEIKSAAVADYNANWVAEVVGNLAVVVKA